MFIIRLNFIVSSPALTRKRGRGEDCYYTDSIFGDEREGDTNKRVVFTLVYIMSFSSIIKWGKRKVEAEREHTMNENKNIFHSFSPFISLFVTGSERIDDLDIIFDNKCRIIM